MKRFPVMVVCAIAGVVSGVMAQDERVDLSEPVAIRAQGFEGTLEDTWPYHVSPVGQGALSTERRYAGAYALRLAGSVDGTSDAYVELVNTSLAGYSNVTLVVPFAAAGPDSGDDLHVLVSYDQGATWSGGGYGTQVADGYGNWILDFGATDPPDRTRTTNPYVLHLPGHQTQIMARIRFFDANGANNASDYYYVDDLQLRGTPVATNAAPTHVELSSCRVLEQSGTGEWVGSFSATDAEGGVMTYRLVEGPGDTDNGHFYITGSNLYAATSFDFATTSFCLIRVRATDDGGLSCDATFTISILPSGETLLAAATLSSESAPLVGARVWAGMPFTKTWVMSNAGTRVWTASAGDTFAFGRGDRAGAATVTYLAPGEVVPPGGQRTFPVAFIAPTNRELVTGFWSMHRHGTNYGQRVWLWFQVETPDIAIATSDRVVGTEIAAMTLLGTAHESVVGDLSWTNPATEASGRIPVSSTWTIPDVLLALGDNRITLRGTNAYGVQGEATVSIKRLSTCGGPDQDSDGLPDWWEIYYGEDATSLHALDDSDGDGMNNMDEHLAGTNPLDEHSVFAVRSSVSIGSHIVIEWPSVDGRIYNMWWTTALTNPFAILADTVSATPPLNSLTGNMTGIPGSGFYKLSVAPASIGESE